MQILPSLLEYTVESLDKKLTLLSQNPRFDLTCQTTLHLHLDFVEEFFAKERNIRRSLGFGSVCDRLSAYFSEQTLTLTIHFMGELDDLPKIFKTLQNYPLNPLWNYLFFVPQAYLPTFTKLAETNVAFGTWFDVDAWQPPENSETAQLLMTVKAGLSGQKLTPRVKELALEFTRRYPNYFVLDGGWSIAADPRKFGNNVDLVSHSSFWNTITA